MWVTLVLEHESDVGGDVVRRLVAFFGEGDFGALLPAPLDDDVEDLVFGAHAAAVRVEAAPRDAHALGAAVEDLLQRDAQLVHHRRVLHAPPPAEGLCPLRPPTAAVVEAVEPVEGAEAAAEVTPGAERVVVPVHVDVVVMVMVAVMVPEAVGGVVARATGAEEDVEGVGAPKEGGEGGVRVAVERVVVGAP